jgi:hypothetical protein
MSKVKTKTPTFHIQHETHTETLLKFLALLTMSHSLFYLYELEI